MTADALTVLLVDDDDIDVMSARRCWDKLRIRNALEVVRDGEACVDYLQNQGGDSTAKMPGVILLDINMPRMNGIEVLKYLRGHASAAMRCLPVVMFTSSSAESDREAAYGFGANAYVVKPSGYLGYMAAIETINEFWELATLP